MNFFSGIATATFKAVHIQVGIGVGYGVFAEGSLDGINVSIDASTASTDSIVLDNGNFDVVNSNRSALGFAVENFFNLSLEGGHSHSFFDLLCTCDVWNSTFGEKAKCPANKETQKVDSFVGVSAGIYLAMGGEISIGIDIDGYLKD